MNMVFRLPVAMNVVATFAAPALVRQPSLTVILVALRIVANARLFINAAIVFSQAAMTVCRSLFLVPIAKSPFATPKMALSFVAVERETTLNRAMSATNQAANAVLLLVPPHLSLVFVRIVKGRIVQNVGKSASVQNAISRIAPTVAVLRLANRAIKEFVLIASQHNVISAKSINVPLARRPTMILLQSLAPCARYQLAPIASTQAPATLLVLNVQQRIRLRPTKSLQRRPNSLMMKWHKMPELS